MSPTASVEFGIAMPLLHDAVEEARRVEALGYDYVVTGEHLMFHIPTGNNFVSLAAAAGATTTLKLFSGIVLAPLYPPALLAKQAAVLDVVSKGRFTMGVGVGGEFPKEFDAVGVPVTERGARLDEALEVVELLLTGDDVHFDGRFTRLDGVTIRPKPVQKPRFPIWVAGRKAAPMRRAGRHAEGWMPYMYTPEMLADSMEQVGAFATDAGRPAGAVAGGIYAFACVHEDRATALEMANQQLSKQYAQDFSKLVGKYAVAGTPDDCVARLREFVDAGAEVVVLAHGCSPEYHQTNTRLIAEEVLPAFR